jgi:hypothetical protein
MTFLRGIPIEDYSGEELLKLQTQLAFHFEKPSWWKKDRDGKRQFELKIVNRELEWRNGIKTK